MFFFALRPIGFRSSNLTVSVPRYKLGPDVATLALRYNIPIAEAILIKNKENYEQDGVRERSECQSARKN